MALRLVHLSDIHFQGYGAGWDEDADQRAELIRDLERLLDGRSVDAVVVGGDIAFSGELDEYEIAQAWLEELCATCDVDLSRIWVVPGNHDVSRTVIGQSQVVRDFRQAVHDCSIRDIDKTLKHRLSQDPAAEATMLPLANYNGFAAAFGCAITAKDPHWYDDSTLSCDGHAVRLTGLNSVLISDKHDDRNQDSHKLVLGTWQCTLPRGDGMLHIAVSHHPPEWLRDWEVVKPYFDRAHVVLFGHEHQFAATQQRPRGSVFVYAGAVGPQRLGGLPDDEYLPSWALLTLECEGDELVVTVEPRVWNRPATMFTEHPDGLAIFTVLVDLQSQEGETVEDEPAEHPGMAASPLAPDREVGQVSVDSPTGSERRQLGVEFMKLAPTHRLDIARRLGVLEEPDDLDLPKPKLYETILRRIREQELIDQLIEELEHG